MKKSQLFIQHRDAIVKYRVYDYTITSDTICVDCGVEGDDNLASIIAPAWSKIAPIDDVRIIKYDVTIDEDHNEIGLPVLVDHAVFHKCSLINAQYGKGAGSVQYMIRYEYVRNGPLEAVDVEA